MNTLNLLEKISHNAHYGARAKIEGKTEVTECQTNVSTPRGQYMDNSRTNGSPFATFHELWLTPLIGVVGLFTYSLHDHHSLWHSLGNKLVPAILLAVPLLMLAALVTRLLKMTPLPLWARLILAVVLSYIIVAAFYFVAAAHYYQFFFPSEPFDESRGDIVTIWQGEADSAGMIAVVATVLSSLFASRLSKQHKRV